jgi:hypothetical protein
MRLQWQQWMQMEESLDRVKWTNDEWPSRRIPNSNIKGHDHDTRKPKNFIVVDVPQSMAHSSGQYLVNNVEDVVRMVISAGCARSEAQKVDNQE